MVLPCDPELPRLAELLRFCINASANGPANGCGSAKARASASGSAKARASAFGSAKASAKADASGSGSGSLRTFFKTKIKNKFIKLIQL